MRTKNMNKFYKIPLLYEEGKYLLKDIRMPDNMSDSECIILEYEEDCDIISNSVNDIRTYGLCIDILEETEVIYRSTYAYGQKGKGNNLDSVCFIKDNKKYPMFFDYNENIYKIRKSEILETVQKCIEKCSADLTDALKELPAPLPSLVVEYYLEGDDSSIGIMDTVDEEHLGLQLNTGYLLDCIIKSIPKCDVEIVFHSIIMSIYNRLCFEIPARYALSDSYQLFLPERYD